MTIEEIVEHFRYSQGRIPLDARLVTEFPGYVRSLYIARASFAVVEFEQWGFDEGGAYFFGGYGDYKMLVESIEVYLNCPVGRWAPLGPRDYPAKPSAADIRHGSTQLGLSIRSGTVALPAGATYELRGSVYWKRYLADHYISENPNGGERDVTL